MFFHHSKYYDWCNMVFLQENVMHCTMKSNISHCFSDKLQEGSVVSMRYFTVQTKDEYRIIKDNTYLIKLNSSTSVRKALLDGLASHAVTFSQPLLLQFQSFKRLAKLLTCIYTWRQWRDSGVPDGKAGEGPSNVYPIKGIWAKKKRKRKKEKVRTYKTR